MAAAPLRDTKRADAVATQLATLLGAAVQSAGVAWSSVVSVGLANPGLCTEDGCVTGANHLWGDEAVPLAALVARAFPGGTRGPPVVLVRDADAALAAEAVVGAVRGCRHAALLSLGTGVGLAALVDGRPLGGARG